MMADNAIETSIIPVDTAHLGHFNDRNSLETWELTQDQSQLSPLLEAVSSLKSGNTPIAFHTDTVYVLGADATNSNAIKAISTTLGQPSANPLIVHICDLTMLSSLLAPTKGDSDSIPVIYKPLIKSFWPGPLAIILPNPNPSKLAPEVTGGLPTVNVRMPDSDLALSLIKLAGVPLAVASANTPSTPPSTTAPHVLVDFVGKSEIILDGGPCKIGVGSTIVNGLCNPPVILRAGGIGIEQIRNCEGWHDVVEGHKDTSEKDTHYRPKATVILYEAIQPKTSQPFQHFLENSSKFSDTSSPNIEENRLPSQRILKHLSALPTTLLPRIGIITTKTWTPWADLPLSRHPDSRVVTITRERVIQTSNSFLLSQAALNDDGGTVLAVVVEVMLRKDTKAIAHDLFSALRELDERKVDVIHVEGINDGGGDGEDLAPAVMDRLRKMASIIE